MMAAVILVRCIWFDFVQWYLLHTHTHQVGGGGEEEETPFSITTLSITITNCPPPRTNNTNNRHNTYRPYTYGAEGRQARRGIIFHGASLFLWHLFASQSPNGSSSFQSTHVKIRPVSLKPFWPMFRHVRRFFHFIRQPILLCIRNSFFLCTKCQLTSHCFDRICR